MIFERAMKLVDVVVDEKRKMDDRLEAANDLAAVVEERPAQDVVLANAAAVGDAG